MKPKTLPTIANCDGCGVCCLHMGYPAFMLPRAPISFDSELTKETQQLLISGWTQAELESGTDGESHWHNLPEELRTEWLDYVKNYESVEELDGPCFWFDMESRQCKNHPYRPQVCRDFEVGSETCHQWRRHYHHTIK